MYDVENKPLFSIERIYLKDISLEQPNSLIIRLEQDTLSAEVEVNVNSEKLKENTYESIVTCTVTVKTKNSIALLIEAQQAGIFKIHCISTDQIDQIIGIVCPTIVFPYLRSNIADSITRADFPPIHLAEINFQALYEQRMNNLKRGSVD